MTNEPPPAPIEQRLRAPLWLYIVLLGLISAKSIEIAVTLNNSSALADLSLPFSVLVRIAFAGGWLVMLTVCVVTLFRQSTWAVRWIVPVISLYALTHVLWQVLFFRSDFDRGRLGFQILISAALLLPLWAVAWQRGWLKHSVTP